MLDDVFLCTKKRNSTQYECRAFEDFVSADIYYQNHYQKDPDIVSTMIPVCKFNPFKKFTLWYRVARHKIDIIPPGADYYDRIEKV